MRALFFILFFISACSPQNQARIRPNAENNSFNQVRWPSEPIDTVSGRNDGCIGLRAEECFRYIANRYSVDWRALSDFQRFSQNQDRVLSSTRNEDRYFTFPIFTPRAILPFSGNDRRRLEPSIHEITLKINSNDDRIRSITLNISGWIIDNPQTITYQQLDQRYIWPLFNDLIPEECRFVSRQNFYQFLATLSSSARTTRGTSAQRFQYVSDYVNSLSGAERCGHRLSLWQRSREGISAVAGSFYDSSTQISFDPSASSLRRTSR